MNNVDVSSFLPLVLVFAAMYFFVIRPQSKKAKEHKAMLNALQPKDTVVTSGGLIGSVISLSEREVNLELSPGVKVTVLRTMIAEKINKSALELPGKTQKAPQAVAQKKAPVKAKAKATKSEKNPVKSAKPATKKPKAAKGRKA